VKTSNTLEKKQDIKTTVTPPKVNLDFKTDIKRAEEITKIT
jgi:hypothetical protein